MTNALTTATALPSLSIPSNERPAMTVAVHGRYVTTSRSGGIDIGGVVGTSSLVGNECTVVAGSWTQPAKFDNIYTFNYNGVSYAISGYNVSFVGWKLGRFVGALNDGACIAPVEVTGASFAENADLPDGELTQVPEYAFAPIFADQVVNIAQGVSDVALRAWEKTDAGDILHRHQTGVYVLKQGGAVIPAHNAGHPGNGTKYLRLIVPFDYIDMVATNQQYTDPAIVVSTNLDLVDFISWTTRAITSVRVAGIDGAFIATSLINHSLEVVTDTDPSDPPSYQYFLIADIAVPASAKFRPMHRTTVEITDSGTYLHYGDPNDYTESYETIWHAVGTVYPLDSTYQIPPPPAPMLGFDYTAAGGGIIPCIAGGYDEELENIEPFPCTATGTYSLTLGGTASTRTFTFGEITTDTSAINKRHTTTEMTKEYRLTCGGLRYVSGSWVRDNGLWSSSMPSAGAPPASVSAVSPIIMRARWSRVIERISTDHRMQPRITAAWQLDFAAGTATLLYSGV